MTNATALRPPGMGELVVRALGFSALRFVPLLAASAVVWLPTSIAQAFAQTDLGSIDLRQLLAAVMAHHQVPPEFQAEVERLQRTGQPAAVLSAVLTPLANAAIIVTAAGFLDRVPVTPASVLRAAARLWLPALVVALLFKALGLVAMAVATVIVAVPVFIVLALLFAIFHLNTATLAVAMTVTPLLVAFVIFFVVEVMSVMAYVALIEDANPIRAVASAVRRALDRNVVRRTMLIGLVYGAITAGVTAAFIAAWFTGAFAHAGVAVTILMTLGGSYVSIVLLVFVLLYTRDIRVRREGMDLLLDDAGLSDRELIDRFLARRETLAPQARAEIAARIGRRVRPNLQAAFDHLDDEALFEHLARSR